MRAPSPFASLRDKLHAAAEQRIQAVEEGTNATAIQHALEVGKAVEMPDERLAAARNTFDEMQAKRRREKLAAASEERRLRKEEETRLRAEAEAAAAPVEADEEKNRKGQRKAAVPSRYVKKGSLGKKADVGEGMSLEEQQVCPPLLLPIC